MLAIATVVVLGLASYLGPAALGLPVYTFSIVAVACGVVLAFLAGGRVAPEPLAFGAVAAFTAAALAPVAPVLAGGVGLAIVFGARSLRARSSSEICLHLAAALVAGAAAAWVSARFAGDGVGLRAAAAMVTALVAASPMLLPVDDHLSFELRRLARRCRLPATRKRLVEAAELQRAMSSGLAELPRVERRRVLGAFDALVGLARRLAGTGAESTLDRTAGRLLAALVHARSAMERRAVVVDEVDGQGMTELSRAVEGIEAEAAAYEEVRADAAEEGMRQWLP